MKWLVWYVMFAGLIAFIIWVGGYHFVKKPTPDQLYGCTVEQADAATGECK